MKILVDENIPLMTVIQLRSDGFDVKDIRGTPEQGITDAELWQMAQKEKRILITTDKGFSSQRNESHYGLLIIRLRQPSRLKIHQRVMQSINKYSADEWRDRMVIMRDRIQSSWIASNNK
jgi:predicted nuclease of predicted toxin-antitoxin system